MAFCQPNLLSKAMLLSPSNPHFMWNKADMLIRQPGLVGPFGCEHGRGKGVRGPCHQAAQATAPSFALAPKCSETDMQKIETGDQPENLCMI